MSIRLTFHIGRSDRRHLLFLVYSIVSLSIQNVSSLLNWRVLVLLSPLQKVFKSDAHTKNELPLTVPLNSIEILKDERCKRELKLNYLSATLVHLR